MTNFAVIKKHVHKNERNNEIVYSHTLLKVWTNLTAVLSEWESNLLLWCIYEAKYYSFSPQGATKGADVVLPKGGGFGWGCHSSTRGDTCQVWSMHLVLHIIPAKQNFIGLFDQIFGDKLFWHYSKYWCKILRDWHNDLFIHGMILSSCLLTLAVSTENDAMQLKALCHHAI